MTIAGTRMTNVIPIKCLAGSLCCRAKSIWFCLQSPRRRSRGGLLLDELFAADDADLGQPEALCRCHYPGDNRVLGVLVRTKVQLGLDRLGGSGLEIFLKRCPIGQR